jgi:hypothetical protein
MIGCDSCGTYRGVVMTQLGFQAADSVKNNPLHRDPVLFDMYMSALDRVLADKELGVVFDEFGLTRATLRMRMVTTARRVFESAPRELAAYENALAHQFDATQARPEGGNFSGRVDFRRLLRLLGLGIAVAAGLGAVAAVVGLLAGSWTEPLLWSAGTMLTVAVVAYAALRLLNSGVGLGLIRREVLPGMSSDVVSARYRLMEAIGEDELLSQVRTFVNTARRGRFGHEYCVVDSPGLSEVYDSSYSVPTNIATEMDGLLARLDGASIGVAGPRGSGKSTLIRGYCDVGATRAEPRDFGWAWSRENAAIASRGDLRCVVAAPVDYIARDFVLHMFAAFCRAVTDRYGRKSGGVGREWARRILFLAGSVIWWAAVYAGLAAILWHWRHTIANRFAISAGWVWLPVPVILFAGTLAWWAGSHIARWRREGRSANDEALAAAAKRHLARVRYLQTYTTGWSGGLRLPGGGDGQYSRGVSRAEQPRSYPEIVDGFRTFAREVAADINRKGERVFIGVDELDKIGSAEKAERFLNEIKGIFGIPHLYFMVSVSDDALTAFERRGLPLRDAFDSSFDEIIRVTADVRELPSGPAHLLWEPLSRLTD